MGAAERDDDDLTALLTTFDKMVASEPDKVGITIPELAESNNWSRWKASQCVKRALAAGVLKREKVQRLNGWGERYWTKGYVKA